MPHTERTRRRPRYAWSALVAVLLTLVVPASAAYAATTCTQPSVSNYHLDGSGQLRRWAYSAPFTGTGTWTQALISPTWTAARTFSGGDGVIFAITGSGNLLWYKDLNFNGTGGANWDPHSGSQIGAGWSQFPTVIGGGDGVIYAVTSDGRLIWYRYTGTAGEVSWANNANGRQIGTGWNAFTHIVASGNGVLYGVTSAGYLLWYRDLDPLGGAATWANNGAGKTLGTGWRLLRRRHPAGPGQHRLDLLVPPP
jgi:hypothetical protein